MNVPDAHVGQPLIMECNVTTVGYITSRVDIIWSENNIELTRTEDVNVTDINNNNTIYIDKYNIPQVNTNSDGKIYECKIIINQNPPLIAIAAYTLDVIGKYCLHS